jgi:hypothetical protein
MSTPEEEAKQKILEAVRELEDAKRKVLLEDVAKDLNLPQQAGVATAELPAEKIHMRYLFSIGLLLLAALGMAAFIGETDLLGESGDTKTLLMLLGFVVALASYLASVARETVKKMATLEKRNTDDRLKLKRNIAWTTAAEIQLVLLGLLTIVRVAAGAEPFMPVFFFSGPVLLGNFLVAYLCLILIFLSGLHMRVWVSEAPFKHAG